MSPKWIDGVLDFWFGADKPDDLAAATRTRIRRDGPRSIHRPTDNDLRPARVQPRKEPRMPLPPAARERLARLTSQPVTATGRTLDVAEARRARIAAERPLPVGAVRAARAAAAKPPKAAPKPKPRRGIPLGAVKHTYKVGTADSFTTYVRVPTQFSARWREAVEDLSFALRAHSVEVREHPYPSAVSVDYDDGRQFVEVLIDSRKDSDGQQDDLRRGLAEAAFRAVRRGAPWTAAARSTCAAFTDRIASDRAGGPIGGTLLVQRAYDAARQVR